MENLNIEKFNPTKVELMGLADRYKGLEIKGVEDKAGYQLVDTARKDLKAKRVEITKTGKALRDDANKFAKKVIEIEKELVAVIEPLEIELKTKQDEIDLIIEKEKRKALLPERIEKLKSIHLDLSDDEILGMDTKTFIEFYNEKKELFLEERERRLQEEKDKIEASKIEEERKKAQELAIENAKKETEEKMRREAKEKEEKERLEQIEREKAEAEKLKATKEYNTFLSDNGYTEATKDNFFIKKEDNKITLFKKIGELKINL